MKIAVSSQGAEMTSRVDPRFGRAQYFIIVDTSNDEVKVIENTQNLGNLGPKAFATLTAAGIKTALWAEGTVEEAVQLAKDNKIQISDSSNVEGHWM